MQNDKPAKKSILIIEDCEVTTERLCLLFKDTFRVLLAATASEGLAMLSEDISIVILDYMLPDKSGLDILKEIKTRYPPISVIVITGYGTEDVCQKAFRLGAIDYIKKPFGTAEIKAKVEFLMEIHNKGLERRQPVFIGTLTEGVENTLKGIPSDILNGIIRAKNYIDKNYISSIHISELTKKAGMNRTYFCHYFKLITGYTFKDYLTIKRFKMARELLKNKNLRISDVAEHVGYTQKYFSEAFKKSFGIPPKKSED
ncbi:MAG: response regulator transcription factor [Nitrospirae bacterium]|nr:response regulator transcription factor [Nitrospirota bacterium]